MAATPKLEEPRQAAGQHHCATRATHECTTRELVLQVAPHKANSLRQWLAARSVTASITAIGTVTVTMLDDRPELGILSALVRGWMREESVEALFATCHGVEVDVALDLRSTSDPPCSSVTRSRPEVVVSWRET
jgi:hypothetical protein